MKLTNIGYYVISFLSFIPPAVRAIGQSDTAIAAIAVTTVTAATAVIVAKTATAATAAPVAAGAMAVLAAMFAAAMRGRRRVWVVIVQTALSTRVFDY